MSIGGLDVDDTMTAARFRELAERLALIEDQLEILSAKVGVRYERPSYDEIPASVRELKAAGKRIEAIVELRRLKNYGLAEASSIVDEL